MQRIRQWLKSTAGKISIVLIIVSVVLIFIEWSTLGSSTLSEHDADTINNVLMGIATNLIGIVVTVSFVQYFLDKQDEKKEKESEKETIWRFDRYMQTLIRRYLMFYISVTTRISDRDKVDFEHVSRYNCYRK